MYAPNTPENSVLDECKKEGHLEHPNGEAGNHDPDHGRLLGEGKTEKSHAQHCHPDHGKGELEPQRSAAVEVVPGTIVPGSLASVRSKRALPPG
jgi:hypothetical protein